MLQENVIVHGIKTRETPEQVLVSGSSGQEGSPIRVKERFYVDLISPSDHEFIIHFSTEESHDDVREKMSGLKCSLSDLGLVVSTGRVVDFRSQEHLCSSDKDGVLPLIRPCHFRDGVINWPAAKERKPCAIVDVGTTRDLLVPSGNYVLVKRFTAKEEKRRIVAAVYDSRRYWRQE